ncbi:hypothetical protein DER46DRAFT_576966 [Fusarium sp. MPI-SDFR-AT-0072]|nr:hypothetical protein DER46DRAFT_576966 [Fusarium sp. MPI-SDFR-AT-0072]
MDKRDRAAIGGSNYMYMHLGHAARPSGPFISWPFTALLPVALSHHSHPIPSLPHPPTWPCKVLVLKKHDEGATCDGCEAMLLLLFGNKGATATPRPLGDLAYKLGLWCCCCCCCYYCYYYYYYYYSVAAISRLP